MTAEQPSVEALVETIRAALTMDAGTIVERRHTAGHAALDSLTAALERAERQAQERLEEVMRVSGEAAGLESRAQKAEAERDVAREFAGEKQTSLVRQWREQAQKAEVVVEAARLAVAQHEDEDEFVDMGKLADALTAYDADLIPARRDGEPPTPAAVNPHFSSSTEYRGGLMSVDEPPTEQA